MKFEVAWLMSCIPTTGKALVRPNEMQRIWMIGGNILSFTVRCQVAQKGWSIIDEITVVIGRKRLRRLKELGVTNPWSLCVLPDMIRMRYQRVVHKPRLSYFDWSLSSVHKSSLIKNHRQEWPWFHWHGYAREKNRPTWGRTVEARSHLSWGPNADPRLLCNGWLQTRWNVKNCFVDLQDVT